MSLVLLHPDDNVVVLAATLEPGDRVSLEGHPVTVTTTITVGHKLARRALRAGDKVLKYGAPIGSMTADAAPGDHVHLHNMKSDYIASHTRQVTGGSEA